MIDPPVRLPTALTIAGSDSGGGAGIQADLKTFQALGVYGASAITALTAQNTLGVQGVLAIPPAFVAAQIDSVLDDIGADAVKIGMLADAGIVEAVADRLIAHGVTTLVVDPVMIAKGGDALLAPEAQAALIVRLLPLATVVTPNLHEASALLGWPVRTLDDMVAAATAIHALGPAAVLVKGGHTVTAEGDPSEDSIDVLYDGRDHRTFRAARIETRNTHGTGCTYAAAIAAELAKGQPLAAAVAAAKGYITEAIRYGADAHIGAGHGPVAHAWAWRTEGAGR
ncbi:MAG: bifunctional hydroxymethylpyrimidine kinase/phosphomethylpyrimidine kinase [Ardenticatenales bacterium]